MFYTVYKITNLINDKIYVGVHKTSNLEDGYMGSGTHLKKAQEKYGIENFKKEILEIFDNMDDMLDMESVIVNEEFVDRSDTYNLIIGGGKSTFYYLNDAKLNLYGKNGQSGYGLENLKSRADMKELMSKEDWDKWNEKISQSLRQKYAEGFENPFLGKTHTEETKKKIGQKSKVHQKGNGNSQYGTRWIYSLEEKKSKKIKKNEPLPEGWNEGRKIKFN